MTSEGVPLGKCEEFHWDPKGWPLAPGQCFRAPKTASSAPGQGSRAPTMNSSASVQWLWRWKVAKQIQHSKLMCQQTEVVLSVSLYIYRRLGWGWHQPGNCFVSFVRAYARSGCRVEFRLKRAGGAFAFPLCAGAFPFSLLRVQWILMSSSEFSDF